MKFRNEKDFEDALVAMLPTVGWEDSVLENYDETKLLQNWANILFENNRGIDRDATGSGAGERTQNTTQA